ncbi:ankyrin repeat domain-containing protein [Bdellovibrionota bacterium FG-2]
METNVQSRRKFFANVITHGAVAGAAITGMIGAPKLGLFSIDQDASKNAIIDHDGLARAIFEGDTVAAARIMIENGTDVTVPVMSHKGPMLPIHLAIMNGDATLLEYLREEETKKGIVRDLTFYALGRLSLGQTHTDYNVSIEMALMLSGFGIDLGARSAFGHQALHLALHERSWAVAEILIDLGAPVDDLDGSGKTPLMLAVSWPKGVELLIKKGARVNYVAPNGQTPLNRAVLTGNIESVKFLLRAGASRDMGAVCERTLFDFLHDHNFVMGADVRAQMIRLLQG